MLLKRLTKTVIETALNEEMTEHLGYERRDPAGAGTGNIRNGIRANGGGGGQRSCRGRRAQGPRRDVRAVDREEAAAAAQRGR
jgi:hypothetical protein